MYTHFFKRVFDVLISFVSILILSPLFLLLIIILFFANQRAGVFFTQKRPGRNAKIFSVIKFKTMKDTRDLRGNLLPDEQRVTMVGKFIRSTSLDEIPQLFNVLIGNMSLIGPRPLLPEYLSLYSSEQMRRHEVRPGITGWAQCHGRNGISWREKFEMDVWYVDHVSFMLDLRILCRTIQKVVLRKGINSDVANRIGRFNGKN